MVALADKRCQNYRSTVKSLYNSLYFTGILARYAPAGARGGGSSAPAATQPAPRAAW